jgi:hypothetical protein
MTDFEMPRTAVTPLVRLQPAENHLRFEGDCYPENPLVFFEPFFNALESHLSTRKPRGFIADFHLRYVNSASTVALRRLFQMLDRLGGEGGRVIVRWEHDAEDDVGEELGRDLADACRHATVVAWPIEAV